MSNLLQRIQRLQFVSRGKAEALLRDFIIETFPELTVQYVELRPQAVSLNSFNGFLTLADGGKLFFKTHTEEDNVIDEYYNASMLAEAGYPVIKPLYSSTTAGQHLLIYEVIDDPSVFDVAWSIEQGELQYDLKSLTEAQNYEDKALFERYLATLAVSEDVKDAPVHQLFYHRLVGGRMDRFYSNNVVLPDMMMTMESLKKMRWHINEQVYEDTLQQIIARAIQLLKPAANDITVIGHGDAHNGNVFFRQDERRLLYFDPAFAGRHHPLLDLTKPIFHNVSAMWMYFPQIKAEKTHIQMKISEDTIMVEHDYDLPDIRHMFLESKVDHVLIPLLGTLKQRGQLRDDWHEFLKCALFCCPFLTLNLTDSVRFLPSITLLGLSMAVEMGAESQNKRSLIDQTLDRVSDALS